METRVTINDQEFDFDAVVNLMDDDLRELLHRITVPGTTPQQFVNEYCMLHKCRYGDLFVVN